MTGEGATPTPVGVVLAGGSGSRLGGAKAAALLAKRPLISYPVEAFRAAGLRVVVLAKGNSDLGRIDCEVLSEPALPVHPLSGLVAALEEFAPAPIVVCPCDMPFVPAALLAHLAGLVEPLVLAAPAGRVQPLLGRYEHTLGPALAGALGELAPVTAAIAALDPRLMLDGELEGFGDPGTICANINTPADLAAAERLLAAGPPGPRVS